MTEKEAVSALGLHEEFIRHVERGSSKIKTLSAITIVVALALAVSYVYQLLLPYISDTTTVVVNLVDPVLQATQAALVVLVLAWLYVGVRDLMFTRRMADAIRKARAQEREIEGRVAG